MKFLNKTVQFAAIIAVTAFGLVACNKKDTTDLLAVDAQLAQKTLLGNYVSVQIDSSKMTTTITEWKFENGSEGKVGVFKEASVGNGVESFKSAPITWSDATLSADKLYYTVPVVVNGESKNLIWRDGVIEADDYVTVKQVISIADIAQTLNTDFANLNYVYNDTVNFQTVRFDSVPFLYWNTQVVEYSQTQIEEYKAYLAGMTDTIAWFNLNYPPSARGASDEIPDTVRFSTKPLANGLYRGLIPIATEDTAIVTDTTVYGPSQIINSELVFSRDDSKKNTGSYSYQIRTWSDDYYLNPGSAEAVAKDSLFVLDDAAWAVTSFTNAKKFVATMKGNQTITLDGKADTKAGAFVDFSLSSFNTANGTVELNGLVYKLK